MRYLEKHGKHILISAVGVCCCLKTCNSVVNILVMGLVLGPSLKIIYICYIKKSPLYNVLWGALFLFTRKVHCLQTFEHMSAHWAMKV